MSYQHPILVPGSPGHNDPEALRSVIQETAYRPAAAVIDTLNDLLYGFEDLLGIVDSLGGNHYRDIDDEREALKALHEAVRETTKDLKSMLEAL